MRSFSKVWTYLVLGLLLFAFSACAPQAGPEQQNASTQTPVVETPTLAVPTTETPSVTETPGSNPLSGTRWQLVSIAQTGAETPVVAGSPVTLEFQENGQAVGSGGCNSFGSQYQVQAGELSFSPVTHTEMACTGAGIMEQEQAYFQALQSAGKFELSGDQLKIEYNGGQGALIFTPEQASTPTETPGTAGNLSGTRWQLESFGAPSAETPVIQGSTLTLEFDPSGRAGGNGGCNSFGGEYHVEDDQLTFGKLTSTLMACADQAVMDQEGRYLGALQAASEYTLEGDRLVISSGGQNVLNFVRAGGSQAPGETTQVVRIFMQSAQEGWATGGQNPQAPDKILFTGDGGATWHDRTPPALPVSNVPGWGSPAVFFAPGGLGWAAYPGQPGQDAQSGPVIWLTQDSGKTWTSSQPLDFQGIPAEFFAPSDLAFLDGQFGWILAHMGAGMSHDYIALFTTQDGGQTWQRVADPDKNPEIQSCAKSGLVFTSPSDGWLSGDCPGLMPSLVFYHSTDGGATWVEATLPAAEGMPAGLQSHLGDQCGISQLDRVTGELLKLSLRCTDFEQNTSQSYLYTSQDAGQTWQAAPLPAPNGNFDFISPEEGWLLGSQASEPQANKEVFHTTDGGQTWTTLTQGIIGGQVDFVDPQNGWVAPGNAVVDENGQPSVPALLQSSDGGKTWQELGNQANP